MAEGWSACTEAVLMRTEFPDRRLRLWWYDVSHGSLLIRSPKGLDSELNIDVLFAGVEYISVPRHLRGLSLNASSSSDVAAASQAAGYEVRPEKVFVLVSSGRRHLVIAAGSEVREHDGDIFASPFVE